MSRIFQLNDGHVPILIPGATDFNENPRLSSQPKDESLSEFEFQPSRHLLLTNTSKNLWSCCNIKLGRVVPFIGALLIGMRAAIFTVYLYTVLNTSSFLTAYAHVSLKDEVVSNFRIVCAFLCVKEVLFIVPTYSCLILGATKRKYSLLKWWLIFTGLHEMVDVLGHVGVAVWLKSPFLAFHFPLGIPYILIVVWSTLQLMHEIKMEQIVKGTHGQFFLLDKKGRKAKNLYTKGQDTILPIRMKQLTTTMFVGAKDEPN